MKAIKKYTNREAKEELNHICMEMNLFQRTVLEIYKRKECFGYKVIEAEDMFLILWNNPLISGLKFI